MQGNPLLKTKTKQALVRKRQRLKASNIQEEFVEGSTTGNNNQWVGLGINR